MPLVSHVTGTPLKTQPLQSQDLVLSYLYIIAMRFILAPHTCSFKLERLSRSTWPWFLNSFVPCARWRLKLRRWSAVESTRETWPPPWRSFSSVYQVLPVLQHHCSFKTHWNASRWLRLFSALQCWKCTASWRSSWSPEGIWHCTVNRRHVLLKHPRWFIHQWAWLKWSYCQWAV